MKTQIITLESHDDIISVRDRMSWAKTRRILLVWPKYDKISLRQVDLKVLQRHASSLGAQVGLVTRQRRVRAEAEALGIPVFTSTGDAQRDMWPAPKRKKWRHKVPDKTLREKREQAQVREAAWRSSPVARVGIFVVGVLSVLTLAALFIPSAVVRLKPVVQIQSIEIPVIASSSVNDVYITGSIPMHEKRVTVDGVKKLLVTGEGESVHATDADRERAKDLLSQELAETAQSKLQDEMNAGDVLFDETIIPVQTLSEIYDPPPGTSGSQLTLSLQEEFSAQYADASDLTELALLALNASLPAGFSPRSDSVSIETVSTPLILDDGSFRWTIRAEREIGQNVDKTLIMRLIQGLGRSAAQSRLNEKLSAMSESKIILSPSWWPWVPIVPFRIEVVTE